VRLSHLPEECAEDAEHRRDQLANASDSLHDLLVTRPVTAPLRHIIGVAEKGA